MVLAYLRQEPDLKRHPITLLGWIHEGGGRIGSFRFGEGVAIKDGILGDVYAAGSGAVTIHELLDYANNLQRQPGVHPGMIGLSAALMLIGLLLRSERDGGNSAPTLMNMFGGGYEIALLKDGKFQKLQDFGIAFWEAKVEKDGRVLLRLPRFVLRQSYAGDILLMRALTLEQSREGGAKVTKDDRFAVLPMLNSSQKVPHESLLSFPLDASLLGHIILVTKGESTSLHVRVQQVEELSKRTMTFKEKSATIQVAIRQDFLRDLSASLRRGSP